MKRVLILASVGLAALSLGQSRVHGYTKKNGTYVAPHSRSKANGSRYDNYSSKGNTNPYTGKAGTVDPATPRRHKKKFGIF